MSGSAPSRASGPARLGVVSFLNTAPLYETWKATVHEPAWRVTEAPPATLNRLLHAGQLDLALVSSQEYAIHPEGYYILSGLAIAAEQAVGSVLIFARRPLEELDHQLLLLSSRSRTSASLARLLLEDHYRLQPRYQVGDAGAGTTADGEQPAAVLAIGDEALRLAAAADYPFCYDLAAIWYGWQRLPFVFALWVVREDFLQRQPATLAAIHRQLQRCQRQGLAELAALSRRVAPRIPLSEQDCYRYLAAMRYDLDDAQQQGMNRFFKLLIARREAAAAALPLKIITPGGY